MEIAFYDFYSHIEVYQRIYLLHALFLFHFLRNIARLSDPALYHGLLSVQKKRKDKEEF